MRRFRGRWGNTSATMYTWRLKRSDSGGCATSAARYNVNLHKFTFVHDVPFHHFTELKARSQQPEAKRLKAKGQQRAFRRSDRYTGYHRNSELKRKRESYQPSMSFSFSNLKPRRLPVVMVLCIVLTIAS